MPVQEVACPNCGAPVDISASQARFFKCKYCGTTIAQENTAPDSQPAPKIRPEMSAETDPDAGVSERPAVRVRPTVRTDSVRPIPPSPKPRNWLLIFGILFTFGCGLVSFLPALLAFPAIAALVDGTKSGGLTDIITPKPNIYYFEALALFPAYEPRPLSLAAVTRESEGIFLTYLEADPTAPTLAVRWRLEVPEADGTGDAFFAADDSRVYYFNNTRLQALERNTGQVLWQVAISDKLPYDCYKENLANCVAIFEQTLVTLTDDGVLAGYVLASGAKAWDYRLTETPEIFRVTGGRVVVMDEGGADTIYRVFDPATGAEIYTLDPACPNNIFSNDPQYPDVDDPFYADATGFYSLAGWYDPACVQKWDAAVGERIYQFTFSKEDYNDPTFYPYVFGESKLLSADYDSVTVIDLVNGSATAIAGEEGYRYDALDIAPEALLVIATENRGTTSTEIWAYDHSGSRLWQYPVSTPYKLSAGNNSLTSNSWFHYVIPGQLLLFEATRDPNEVHFQAIDLQTGVSSGTKTLQAEMTSSIYYIWPFGYSSGLAWLMVDEQILGIDPATGAAQMRWP